LELNIKNKSYYNTKLNTMAYSEKVLDHFQNPKNVGTLDKSKKNVGTGLVGAPECGDVMRLQIEVDEVSGTITDLDADRQ
jgi:NifU-like protein involved in Fe-S cluster formation